MSENGHEKKDKLLLQRFGKYLLLDHLVDGGMAKICRARFLGEQADKIVAIKMIQSQFSNDDAFKKMFMDEIRVTFGLIHPNITQTFDYGEEKGQLYQVMEYVHGRNLKEYLDKLKKRGFVFPVEVSVYIIAQACQGLHYAHTFKNNLSGEPAHIIHRDISPHNLMLTYDGALKVIDFGIAKVNSNSDKTQAGTIKGKLSYLAPEYLEGADLDHSYDQFALGITLWEMLCCRKLFTAKTDLAVLKKIQACKVPPPSAVNPNVSKELDQIVLKALSKDRRLRFENLDQFNRALIKFLYANYPEFNATDLAYFAKELFKDEIKRDHQRFMEFGKVDISPYLRELKRGALGSSIDSRVPDLDDDDQDVIIIDDDEKDSVFDASSKKGMHELDLGITEEDKSNLSSGLKMERSALHQSMDGFNIAAQMKKQAVDKGKARQGGEKSSKLPANNPIVRSDRDRLPESKPKSKSKTSYDLLKSHTQKHRTGSLGLSVTKKKRIEELTFSLTNPVVKLGAVAACLALLWFGHSSRCLTLGIDCPVSPLECKGEACQTELKPERRPASVIEIDIQSWSEFKELFLDSTKKPRIYLNDQLITGLDRNLSGKIDHVQFNTDGENILRVIYDDSHEFHVQKLDIVGGVVQVKIPSIDTMPRAQYGYLTGGNHCEATGSISFVLFKEKRQVAVPLNYEGVGIALPLGKHRILYRGNVMGIILKPVELTIEIKKRDDLIDICDYLPTPSLLPAASLMSD